jgi:hypothetical protein
MARPSPEPRRVGREQQAAGAPRLIQTSLEERRRPVASIFSDASQKVGHGTLQHRRARPDDGVSDRHAPAPTRQRSSRRLPTTHDPRPMPPATSAMKTTPAAFAHLEDFHFSHCERSVDLSSRRPLSRNTHARQRPSSWHCRLLPPYRA